MIIFENFIDKHNFKITSGSKKYAVKLHSVKKANI